MFRFIHSNNPLVIVLVVLYALVFNMSIFSADVPIDAPQITDGVLTLLIKTFFGGKIFFYFLCTLLQLVNTLLLYRIHNAHRFLGTYTYLPAVVFILLLHFVPEMSNNISVQFALCFFLLAVNRMIEVYNKNNVKIFFDAGFLLSLMVFFYKPSAFYFLLGIIVLLSFSKDIFFDFFRYLIGYLAPIYAYLAILYLLNNLNFSSIWYTPEDIFFKFDTNYLWIIKYLLYSLPALYLAAEMITRLNTLLIFNRGIATILLLGAFLSVGALCWGSSALLISLALTTPCVALLLSYKMKGIKKWVYVELIHVFLLIFVIIFQFFI